MITSSAVSCVCSSSPNQPSLTRGKEAQAVAEKRKGRRGPGSVFASNEADCVCSSSLPTFAVAGPSWPIRRQKQGRRWLAASFGPIVRVLVMVGFGGVGVEQTFARLPNR